MRVVQDGEDNPWWVAKDVCKVLDIKNSRDAVQNLDDDEKGVDKIYTLGGRQNVITINESGLYTLIFRSNKPEAKVFRRWITNEVLPSIRKTGEYKMSGGNKGNSGIINGNDVRKSGNMHFPMAKLVESADKYLEGRAALKALNYFTGMPVDDLLEELEAKKTAFSFGGLKGTAQNLARAGELIAKFMADCCEFDETYEIQASVLYEAFCSWCDKSAVAPMGQRMFCGVVGKNFKKYKKSWIFYKGLRLKQER